MSVLNVVKWPATVLETKAKEVLVFDDKLKTFVADMHETMAHAKGIGLAANQVNVLKRVIIMNIPWIEGEEEKCSWHDQAFTFINPVITKRSSEMVSWQEGCLSFPSIYDFVKRHKEVTVKAFNEKGEEFTTVADGLLSICLQHEIDHIDGIVFIKRMSRLKAKLAKSKLLKSGIK